MTCDTLGLYARSVEDLELLAKVFQLADDEPIPATPFSLQGAKVAFCKSPTWEKAGPGTQKAFEKAQELLKKSGATVKELELPADFKKIKEWHANVLAGEGRSSFLGRKLFSMTCSSGCHADEEFCRISDWKGENEQEHRGSRGECDKVEQESSTRKLRWLCSSETSI